MFSKQCNSTESFHFYFQHLIFALLLIVLPQGPFSKVVSSSAMHETKMGSVAIQVVTGDITKETTDVIINSSNEDFSLKSGK